MGYIKNLMTALLGNNPYQMELDRVKEEYAKTASRVNDLSDKADELNQRLEDDVKTLDGYQLLIENLRERVAEKDGEIAHMKEEFKERTEGYKRRISDYSGQIARLQGELAKQKKRRQAAKARKPAKKQEEETEKK